MFFKGQHKHRLLIIKETDNQHMEPTYICSINVHFGFKMQNFVGTFMSWTQSKL